MCLDCDQKSSNKIARRHTPEDPVPACSVEVDMELRGHAALNTWGNRPKNGKESQTGFSICHH